MERLTRHGYLVLADISGFTAYLAGVELDHAHEILTDLLEIIVQRFKSVLTLSKLEGDAVFAYAPESQVPRGETLLELLECTYVAFRDRQIAMHRRTTCACNACRSIPKLDLKFITHHGDYLLQEVAGIVELLGSDVNLAHRLMKNHLSETTGWHAYALFSEKSLAHIGVPLEGAHVQTETYDHLGDVKTYSLNLRERYQEITEARRVFLAPAEAHAVINLDFTAPLPVVWEWFNDPQKRGQWMHSEIRPVARPGGRAKAGARNHCVHGQNEVVVEEVLDLRPFDYYTVAHTPQGTPATLLMTYHFMSSEHGGTHVQITFRGQVKSMPAVLGWLICQYALRFQVKRLWAFDKLDGLMTQPETAR